MKVHKSPIPKNSLLKGAYDYQDCYTGSLASTTTNVVEVARAFFNSSPAWISHLFRFRNMIVGLFGLKTGKVSQDPETILKQFQGNVGDKIGLFEILERSEDELIMGEHDKHLDFKVSLMVINGSDIFVSTVVKFNNWFGKLYFLPVKPFHKLIVPTMLKRIIKRLEQPNKEVGV